MLDKAETPDIGKEQRLLITRLPSEFPHVPEGGRARAQP